MLTLVALLAASAEPVRAEPRRQARAVVTITRAVSIRDGKTSDGTALRSTWIRDADGRSVPARLAEYR